jgi:iron complex transport system substrate-binding protein
MKHFSNKNYLPIAVGSYFKTNTLMLQVIKLKLLVYNIFKVMILLLIFFSSIACNQNHEKENSGQKLVFSSSSPVIANGFEIKESATFQLLDCFSSRNQGQPTTRIVLSESPVDIQLLDADYQIRLPLQKIVCMSATHISFLDALDASEKIAGVGSADFIASKALLKRIKVGEVEDIAAGEHFRLEKLIALQPDAVFVSAGQGNTHEAIINAGIPVIPIGEYLENHPLGRAEWIKFFGVLTGKEKRAAIIFDSIKNEYNRLQALTANITDKPTVLSGKQYGGFWNLPGGRSYIAQFLHDAGATYLWNQNKETAGLSLDFETVFLNGINADFWRFLVYSNQPYTYEMLEAEDKRYADFKAFQTRNVITCNTFDKPYHQKGVVEPQIILADLISIFHPELLPHHQNQYYELLK